MREAVFENFVPKIENFFFYKCASDWRINTEFVAGYDITYIIEGKARYTIDDVTYNLGKGDLLFLSEGVKKEAVVSPRNLMRCYTVNFSQLAQLSKSQLPSFPVIANIGLRQDLINLFRELSMCWMEQQNGYIMKSRALLILVLHRLSEILIYDVNSDPGDYRISKITQTIDKNYSDKLTVKDLAEQVHLDDVYFGHLFKKETGMTVHQYINLIRVQKAESLLQSGTYKIFEVADQCGFSDAFHFHKVFKSVRGFPPSRCIPKSS